MTSSPSRPPPSGLDLGHAGTLTLAGGRRIRYRGWRGHWTALAALEPFLTPNLSHDLAIETVVGRPAADTGPRAAAEPATDVFLIHRSEHRRRLAIHDRRRRLTPGPEVFLDSLDGGRRFLLHLGIDDPYHRKLGCWLLVGLLAAWGLLRFAHATAVAGGGGAALIFGPHGAGKSTLAAAALLDGATLLAEGVALLADDGRIVPFFMDGRPVLRVTEAVWRQLRSLLYAEVGEPAIYPSTTGAVPPKRVLAVESLWPGRCAGPVRPTCVWLPRAGPAPPLAVEPLSRRAALERVAGHLEDRRITALRDALGPLPVIEDPRAALRRRWLETFPPVCFSLTGAATLAELAARLSRHDLCPPP